MKQPDDTMEALQKENVRLRTKHAKLQKRIKHHHQDSAQEVSIMMEKRKEMLDAIMHAFDKTATYEQSASPEERRVIVLLQDRGFICGIYGSNPLLFQAVVV